MAEDIFTLARNFMIQLGTMAEPVIKFLLEQKTILGVTITPISLFFGAGIAIYLTWQFITWIANIIT